MSHDSPRLEDVIVTRRELLNRSGMGMGALAFGSLLADDGLLGGPARADSVATVAPSSPGGAIAANPLLPRIPPLQARAKRVVHLFMNGGPSHVDTFDPKPMLDAAQRQAGAGQSPHRAQDRRGHGVAVPVPEVRPERHRGQRAVRRTRPGMIDDICVIRSMHADVPNHEPSLMLMNCGEARQARPCVGSWVLYGLGTENQNLPGFIVMCPGGFPIAESQNWQAAFLPGIYQGTYMDSKHTEIEKLIAHIRNRRRHAPWRSGRSSTCSPSSTGGTSIERQRRGRARSADPVVRAGLPHAIGGGRGVRRQSGAGIDPGDVRPGRSRPPASGHPAAARAGVRFVQLWHGDGQPWDHHDDLATGHRELGQPVRPADRARFSRI